jgi:hypothetical protein
MMGNNDDKRALEITTTATFEICLALRSTVNKAIPERISCKENIKITMATNLSTKAEQNHSMIP